jgi:hypothetical protein
MNRALSLTAAALALAAPPAGAATLSGTTEGGTKITLKRSATKVSAIRTIVPVICVETTGSGYTRAGGELFQPPGAFAIGAERKAKALQPAAINSGNEATKNYTVQLAPAGRRGVRGKLSVNLSFLIPDLFRSLPYIYSCQGTTTFKAR